MGGPAAAESLSCPESQDSGDASWARTIVKNSR